MATKRHITRPLAILAVFFAAALFASHYFHIKTPLIPAAITLLGFAAVLFTRKSTIKIWCLLILAGLCLGFVWRWGFIQWQIAPLRTQHETTQQIRAVVIETPTETRGWHTRVIAQVTLPDTNTPSRRAVLYLDPLEYDLWYTLRAGDVLHFEGLVRVPEPGRDDPLAFFRSRGISLSVVQVRGSFVEDDLRSSVGAIHRLTRLSTTLRSSLYNNLPQSVGGLAMSVFFGDRSGLSPAQQDNVRLSGLAHVTSVSGMHVAFLMGFLLLLFGNKKWAFFPALIVLFIFVALAGFPASAMRAAIMQTLVLFAAWRGRQNDTLTGLAVALAILTAQNPFAVADVGLQLSFTATLGIVLFANRWQNVLDRMLPNPETSEKLPPWGRKITAKFRRVFITGTATSFSALALSLPLTVYYFGQVTIFGAFAGVLAIWAVSTLFLLVPIFLLLNAIWAPLGIGVMVFMIPLSAWFWLVASAIALIPFAAVQIADFYATAWILAVFAIMIVFFTAKHKRKILLPGIACVLIMLIGSFIFSAADNARLDAVITVVDVGQGQAIIVQSEGQVLLIDCGSSNRNASELTIRALRNKGLRHIDYAVITHGHNDHFNGLENVSERVPIRHVAYPAADIRAGRMAHNLNTTALTINEVTHLTVGNAIVTVLPSAAGENEGVNERGLSILIRVGDFSMLVTGDKNISSERRLVGYHGIDSIEVLMVGHHGSRHSTGDILLYMTNPQTGIISVGRNQYGHPHPDALSRLYNNSVDTWTTQDNGNVVIRIRQ